MFDFKPYYEEQRKTVTGFFGVCQNIFLTLIWNKTPVKSNILLCRDSARDLEFSDSCRRSKASGFLRCSLTV